MTTGGYNSKEVQVGVRTKYLPIPGRVKSNPIKLEESLPSKRKQF